MQKLEHEIYSFDEFRLDLTRGSLFRGGTELKLRPKSFDVLKYLAENPGRLVGKDELIEAVWRETAVTDDSLVQCLKDIRNALSDQSQTIIRTVPRRGYIFEKDVTENGGHAQIFAEETTGIHLVIEESEESNGHANANVGVEVSRRRKSSNVANYFGPVQSRRNVLVGLASLVIVLGFVASWRFTSVWDGKTSAEESPPLSATLFQNVETRRITHVGNIVNNSISADGKYAVFTTSDGGREAIWLKQIATESTQQVIAPDAVRYYGVAFSRDGDYIYYLKAENSDPLPRVLYRIPAPLGGVPEKLVVDLDWCPTFSPDGNQIAFVRNSDNRNESILMIANADGTGERQIAARSYQEAYTFPAWSPDGQTIAASAGNVGLGGDYREVVSVGVVDGVEKSLMPRKWYWISYIAWLADGSGLIMSANPHKSLAHAQIWLLSLPSGETRQITSDSHNYVHVSLTADSRTLLAGHTELLNHIWIAPDADAKRARRVTSGLGDYKHIRWTPGGKLIVAAAVSNHLDLWLRDPDSGSAEQLTANAGTNWGQSVSPDNRYIIFSSDRTGDFHIWRMDIDGSNPMQLTNGNGIKYGDGEVSPDGKWVVYTNFQDSTLWKVSIEGGEASLIQTDANARHQSISPDGKWIIFSSLRNDKYGLALIPFQGGSPVKFFDLPLNAPMPNPVKWSRDGKEIYFVAYQDGVGNLWSLPTSGEAPKQITAFISDRIQSFDWSEDGKSLAVIRGAWTSNMALVVNK